MTSPIPTPPPPTFPFPSVPPCYITVTDWPSMKIFQYQLHLEAMERQQEWETKQRELEKNRRKILEEQTTRMEQFRRKYLRARSRPAE
nr:hypothetical protein Iba_chr09dCG13130 [Ipomoea batatas]